MKNRVRFNRKLSLQERWLSWCSPARIRAAVHAAHTVAFEPDVSPRVRNAAIKHLRTKLKDDTKTLRHFETPQALAVYSYMETLREMIPERIARRNKAKKTSTQMASIAQRELEFFQTRLAICALYMRRSGFMDQKMLGDALYRAATEIEAEYATLPAPRRGGDPKGWPIRPLKTS